MPFRLPKPSGRYQVSMPRDEDRSLLIWISSVFDLAILAWMINLVNEEPLTLMHSDCKVTLSQQHGSQHLEYSS